MPIRTINSVTLSYEEKGSGTPLVLLHGFPLDSRIFRGIVEPLARQFRVITPDLRGFGRSTSSEPFEIDTLAQDVHALLHEIKALPCVLGGLSMGGYVALGFQKRCPGDLKGLILIDSRSQGDTADGKAGREKMIELVRSQGSKAVADQMFPKMFAEQTVKQNPGLAQELRTIMESQPPMTIEHALAAMRDRYDYTGDLPSIAVPVLMIFGEHDPITPPKTGDDLLPFLPRAVVKIVPNASHLSAMEQPQIVAEVIRDFVSRIERGDAFGAKEPRSPHEGKGTGW